MAAPYGYWTMFGGPDPTTTPSSLAPTPTVPASSTAPAPVYHSVITGTYDPTPTNKLTNIDCPWSSPLGWHSFFIK